jgi:hypothetical protein
MACCRVGILPVLCFAGLFSAGCTTVAAVSNLDSDECRNGFTSQLAAILSEQGEALERAARLANNTATALASGAYGPRPFLVASPSGTDYSLFLQRKGETCLLRLYRRRKGFMSYTNNLTYIATKTVPACQCVE